MMVRGCERPLDVRSFDTARRYRFDEQFAAAFLPGGIAARYREFVDLFEED